MGFADTFQQRLRAASRKALQQMGREMQADIRELISIPVEKIGSEIIRSDPGEPPRKEFGDLWRSIKYRLEDGGLTVEDLVVYTAYIVAVFLEYGTERIEPRPFWERMRRRFERIGVRKRYKELLAKYLAENATPIDDFVDFGPSTDVAFPESDM